MKDFLIPLLAVFMGEMGDKTQLVTLAFAVKYNWKTVMAGVFCGTLALDFLSVMLGALAAKAVPNKDIISLAAGILFVAFAFWTLKGDGDEDEEAGKAKNPFIAVFLTFFLAEMGDKTMLATVTMAAKYNPWAVWAGAVLGMVLADGIAVYAGMKLGKSIPKKAVTALAVSMFLGFGIYYIFIGIKGLF